MKNFRFSLYHYLRSSQCQVSCHGTRQRLFSASQENIAESKKGPLDGIRICDMSRVLTGPYCTMILGDMGADVIKIERPDGGDETRGWGPPFVESESCYFLSINRNKKGICVDVKHEKGKEILYNLVEKSDVFIENFVPGKMSELGFGYEDLKQINPGLVYASISGFGSHGPDHKKPGYDLIASAMGGLLSITGQKDGEICRPGIAITDIMTGMFTLNAIIAALYERIESGCGKMIDASLFQTQLAMLSYVGAGVLNSNIDAARYGTAHPSIVPYQIFDTLDGKIVLVVANDVEFNNICKVLGIAEISSNEQFSINEKRIENREELILILQNILQSKTTNEWSDLFEGREINWSRINNVKQAFDSPLAQDLNMIQTFQHPTAGKIKVPGPAMNYGNNYNINNTPPPLLGEHTCEILKNLLNYTEEEIRTLVELNVVNE